MSDSDSWTDMFMPEYDSDSSTADEYGSDSSIADDMCLPSMPEYSDSSTTINDMFLPSVSDSVSASDTLDSDSWSSTADDLPLFTTNAELQTRKRRYASLLMSLRDVHEPKNDPKSDKWRLKRFLVLGTEDGVYESTDRDFIRKEVKCINSLISLDLGPEVVDIIKKTKTTGRGCNRESAIYALALCARSSDQRTKRAAYSALQAVCPEPPDLLTFVMFCEMVSGGTGWGRAQRRAVCDWYNSFRDRPMELAEGVTKEQKNGQWTHKDVARLSHVKPDSAFIMLILRYITKGLNDAKKLPSPIKQDEGERWKDMLQYFEAVDKVRQFTGRMEIKEGISIIRKYRLEPSQISAALNRSTSVWGALLTYIPLDQVIQNISKVQQLTDQKPVLERLVDEEQLQKANVNPFAVMLAMIETNDQNVKKTLSQSFELCVGNVKPTEKKYSVVVWMNEEELDSKLEPKKSVTVRDAVGTISTIIAKATHQESEIVQYTTSGKEILNPATGVLVFANTLNGRTQPLSVLVQHVKDALEQFDAIIILMYSPSGNLERKFSKFHTNTGITRLVIVNFSGNDVTVASKKNSFMLDVVGFNNNSTEAIMRFVEGR